MPSINIDPNENSDLVRIAISRIVDINGNEISASNQNSSLTKWRSDLNICQNGMKKLIYEIGYDSNGDIVYVTALVETTNILASAKLVKQEFKIIFIAVEVKDDEIINVKPSRKKSGNPGYIFEHPTLGGTLKQINDTMRYVDAQAEGLMVMRTGRGGRCDSAHASMLVCLED